MAIFIAARLPAALLPAAPAQNAPGRGTGQLAVVVLDLAVDDRKIHAFRNLVGDGVSGAIDDRIGIENDDVGKIAGREQTAIREMLALRWERSELANGGFEAGADARRARNGRGSAERSRKRGDDRALRASVRRATSRRNRGRCWSRAVAVRISDPLRWPGNRCVSVRPGSARTKSISASMRGFSRLWRLLRAFCLRIV